MVDLSIFYNRAYGETWDDELSEEEIEPIARLMEKMTDDELALYDEYLKDDTNECIISEALEFALADRLITCDGPCGYWDWSLKPTLGRTDVKTATRLGAYKMYNLIRDEWAENNIERLHGNDEPFKLNNYYHFEEDAI